MPWTRERLEEIAKTRLNGAKLIVVANREPYIHQKKGDRIHVMRPAGGLTTALDPVMRACGGVWIGHGSGNADRETADANGRLGVPPERPSYTLRRLWLTPEQEEGYYYGFANSGLWPLCHQVYCRPEFNPDHWATYREVNALFAQAVLEEAAGGPAIILIQDYHFALLPQMLKSARSDLVVAQFWHIPWPNPETFAVCPWAKDILEGMLGNDLMAFHTQYHCNNFLETVDRTLECRYDREHFSLTRNGATTRVRPYPISVDTDLAAQYLGNDWETAAQEMRAKHKLADRALLVGVDRLDYTKGIPERLQAFERLLVQYPQWKENVHFLQIGAPSRSTVPAYRTLNEEVHQLATRINREHGTPTWQPIVFLNEHHGPRDIHVLYRMAASCVVSSLHDGMNLVAKEFVAARVDEGGALVLSQFTGAARELTDALIVNPFDVAELASAMHSALTMPSEEQAKRMRRMRNLIADRNIYRWAGMMLSEIGGLVPDDLPLDGKEGTPSSDDNFRPAHIAPMLVAPPTIALGGH